MPDEIEIKFRRGKYAQIARAQAVDSERVARLEQIRPARAAREPEAIAALDAFASGSDVQTFRGEIDRWSRRPGYDGFNSPNGQMFLNQLSKVEPSLDRETLLFRAGQASVRRGWIWPVIAMLSSATAAVLMAASLSGSG